MTLEAAPPAPRPLGRREVARRLGCSVTHVRRLEASGRLRPRRVVSDTGRPRVLHDRADVERLRAETPGLRDRAARGGAARRGFAPEEGEVAARLFARFERGDQLRLIVREERVPPEFVRAMREEWLRTFDDDDRERRKRERDRAAMADRREREREEARRAREERDRVAERTARRRGRARGEGEASFALPDLPFAESRTGVRGEAREEAATGGSSLEDLASALAASLVQEGET